MTPFNDGHAQALVSFLREASLLARRVQKDLAAIGLTKADLSPVTVADFAIQALAGFRLGTAFPDIPLVGEEDSRALAAPESAAVLERVAWYAGEAAGGASPETVCAWIDRGAGEPGGAFWTLDPIDGTKGYLRGGQYAVALALVESGRVLLGGLACPELGMDGNPGTGILAVARRGEGAFMAPLDADHPEWVPMRVSACGDPRGARLLRSAESGHTDPARTEAIVRELGIGAPSVPMDSQAKYAALAMGGGELLLRMLSPDRPGYKEKIWDHAAGSLVLEEAGGRVTDLNGAPFDFTRGRCLEANSGLLASNGLLHEEALRALARVMRG